MTWSSPEQQPDSIERQEQVHNTPTTTAPRALPYNTVETEILYSVYSVFLRHLSILWQPKQFRHNSDYKHTGGNIGLRHRKNRDKESESKHDTCTERAIQ